MGSRGCDIDGSWPGILLKVFDWLTPINEWAEIQKGNLSVAIIMAAVILALGIAVGFAIMPVTAVRP
jgi:uncharacterized membrane protein YjfL (UPF0719 family)